jgi:tRNA (uracil-5-)-methyltransferase
MDCEPNGLKTEPNPTVEQGEDQEMPQDENVSDEEVNSQLNQTEEETVAIRHSFTSENFKIEIRNMPNYCGVGQMKKLLNKKLRLNAHKVKPCGPNTNFMFVCFK